MALLFSKNVYSASLSSYYTFYLIDRFHLSIQTAQFYLVAFLVGIVIGIVAASFTASGMVLGRRIGSIWGARVEVFGGLILLGIGIKIVIEHLSA